jgi:ABC-2 type transport system ATP-binding protein
MTVPILCQELVKSFGPVRALDGLELEVTAGEVHGFLGPNGAGKTVTMRIVLGLLRPDSGTVRLFGEDPWDHAVTLHRRLAYVPGDTNLWPDLTGGEVIDLLGELRGQLHRARRDELIERFDLDPRKKARSYSKGNRQKVALVAALASDAELLVLDEPTAGLDPLMAAVFRDCVLDAREEGRTVLLSSHLFAEVERLCDRVTILRRGRTVQSGTLDQLRHLTRTTITARLRAPAEALAELPTLAGVHDATVDGDLVTLHVDSDELEGVMARLGSLGVIQLSAHPPTLEELFLRHYGDELAEAGLDDNGLDAADERGT